MKILFINISDIHGGAAKSMWRIGEELKELGNEVKFLVRSKFSDSDKVVEIGGNRYINILFNLLGMQYKFLPVSYKVLREAKKFKPDVISLNQIEGGYFQTRDLIKLSKIAPVWWTMHDEWAFNNNASSRALHKVERKIYPQIGIRWGDWLLHQKIKIYEKSDFKMVFPSRSISGKRIIDKKYHIIPHGIDTEKFKPNKIYNLLFVAEKLDKAYKLEEILNELDLITKHRIILTMVGKGRFEKKYKNIIIINRGFCDERELLYYYNNADIFIYPSLADVFGLVVLEAISCELPVVAFNTGGVAEILDGYTVKSVKAFANRIEMLLGDRVYRESMGKFLRNRAIREYDIKKIAEEYLKLWR